MVYVDICSNNKQLRFTISCFLCSLKIHAWGWPHNVLKYMVAKEWWEYKYDRHSTFMVIQWNIQITFTIKCLHVWYRWRVARVLMLDNNLSCHLLQRLRASRTALLTVQIFSAKFCWWSNFCNSSRKFFKGWAIRGYTHNRERKIVFEWRYVMLCMLHM